MKVFSCQKSMRRIAKFTIKKKTNRFFRTLPLQEFSVWGSTLMPFSEFIRKVSISKGKKSILDSSSRKTFIIEWSLSRNGVKSLKTSSEEKETNSRLFPGMVPRPHWGTGSPESYCFYHSETVVKSGKRSEQLLSPGWHCLGHSTL